MGTQRTCAACGSSAAAGAKFCGACGAALAATCPRCGTANPTDGAFCIECGAALGTSALAPDLGRRHDSGPRARVGADAPVTVSSGERKTISVLFADVAGFTSISERLDPEDTRNMMQRAFAVMLDEVHRFEGMVSQFLGDGMLALFGAPIAHEDHAQLAIRAGLAIQSALEPLRLELSGRGIEFRVRVGINSGPVVFGQVGTDLEFTFQAVGDTVNTASRVQGLAPAGGVVVAESTFRLAEGYFEFEDLGTFEVKGKADPLHVFQALRPSRARSRVEISAERGLTPLMGRDRELERLLDTFEEVRAGRGKVVFVSGEPGIGKSRLVYELKARLEGDDVMWLTGRCISYGADIAYVPVVDLIKDACGIEEADSEAEILEKLDAGVLAAGGDPARLPYLRSLLSVDPGDPAVEQQDPALRKARIFEAFRDVLHAAASVRPVVLAIEDLHWVDRPSTELLSFLAEEVGDRPVLVLLTHRPEWAQPFGERPIHVHVPLTTLTDEEAWDLARETLARIELSADERAAIAGKAEGNPFFVEEVARSIAEGNAAISVPDTVQDLITARIDRLPDDARAAIQTASVIGREFTARLLERTAALGPATEPSLRELRGVQLIFERSLYPELIYMFKHALTHDVAYGTLLKERRRALHGAVGDAITDLYADRLPELYEILAHHYEAAERWEDAERFLELAAEKSLAAYAVPEAAAFADRALAALDRSGGEPDPHRLIAIHGTRGLANEFLNDWPPACDSYRAVADIASSIGDEQAAAEAWASLSIALMYAHRFDEAIEATTRAEALGDEHIRATAAVNQGVVNTIRGALDAVLDDLDGLETTTRRATPTGRSMGLAALCEYHHWLGDEARAIALNTDSQAVAFEFESSQSLLWNLWDRALILPGVGRYEEALDSLEEHLRLCRRVSDSGFWIARCLNTTGWVHMQLADWDEGARWNREGLEWAERLGDPEIMRNALLNLADCALATGDPEGALTTLREVEDACTADSAPGSEWMKWRYIQHLWASLSDAWLANGDAERALDHADRCLAGAERSRSKRYQVRGHETRAAALSALGRHDEAVEEGRAAVAAAVQIGAPTQQWRCSLVLGDALAAAGRVEESRAAFGVGLTALEGVAANLNDPGLRETLLGSSEVTRLRAGA